MANILCVGDDSSIARILDDTLTHAGHRALPARNTDDAMAMLARESVDVIVSDYALPGVTGLEFLARLRRDGFDVPLIVLTGYATIEHAVAMIKAGAVDYVTKPVRPEQLELALDRALDLVQLRRDNDALRRECMELRQEQQVVGESPVMAGVLQSVASVAPTRASVLLHGESGTGKSTLARAMHDLSDRRDRPFVRLSCDALPEGLLESALFGHEGGASTDSAKRVDGALERANGGTLMLEEISGMKPELQAKLVRALQGQEFQRVGGTSPIPLDIRIVATTAHDLSATVAAGNFRQDLYERLSDVAVNVPSLRERAADIPLLALRFAVRAAGEMGKHISGIAPDAIAMLQQYSWPGNVRELQHVVERAVIMSQDAVLQSRHFNLERDGIGNTLELQTLTPMGEQPTGSSMQVVPSDCVVLHTLNVDDAERALIKRALEVTRDNRTRAAELLGISVRTLRNKLNVRKRIPQDQSSTEEPSGTV